MPSNVQRRCQLPHGNQWRRLQHQLAATVLLLTTCILAPRVDAVYEVTMDSIVGEVQRNNVTLSLGCPEFLTSFYTMNASQSNLPFRSFTLTKGSAYGYVAIHFAKLWVPRGGSVLLRSVEDLDMPDVVVNLTDMFPSGVLYKDVSAMSVRAKEFRIEFYRDDGDKSENQVQVQASTVATTNAAVAATVTGANTSYFSDDHCYGFAVDWYNYKLVDDTRNITAATESTCAEDNTLEAICYFDVYRESYLASQAVARLLIPQPSGEKAACTGWLLGSEGHFITNNHCIQNRDQASAMTIEFMADAKVCTTTCTRWGACPGDDESIDAEFVYTNEQMDYTILRLRSPTVDLPKKYGFLRLKASQGRVGQQVYIPQYPQFYGKRIAMKSDYNTFVTILSTNATGCSRTGYSYNGDTQEGSSGSPVLDALDHGVVALHHCGQYCANTGVPSADIVLDLKANNINLLNAIDYTDVADPNTQYFPSFTPKEATAPLPLTSRLKLDGTLHMSADGKTVSVDQIEFTLANDADVAIDIMSMEISDDGVYKDLNGDCKAQYMDALVFLFAKDDPKVLKKVDDSDANTGTDDGSINFRDPYLRTFLKKGTYVVAIASMPVKDLDAYNGIAVLDNPEQDPSEFFVCSKRGSSEGSYRVEVLSSDAVSFSRLPQSVTPAVTCGLAASAICSP